MNRVVAAISAVGATSALFLTGASLFAAVGGAIVFTPVLVGLLFLALVGVFSGLENRTVRQRNPSMNPRGWRDGR